MFTNFRHEKILARMIGRGVLEPDAAVSDGLGARDLYELLLESPAGAIARRESRRFLLEQLEDAARKPHDLPDHPRDLEAWMEGKTLEVGARYAEYLEGRKQGAPRRFFSNKAHALSFLQQVAPTKLVDGAWLHGVLPHWNEPRFHGLLRTYLEELGDGDPDQNHVVLYRRLLEDNDCETLPPLSDAHYTRGALQLALAHHAEPFLPEVIGYNLGYEQLPLHLLVTAFELAELDIDPYYFTLHVTVDNAGTGHARRAVQAVKDCIPVAADPTEFWRRVVLGYRLGDAGLGTQDIIFGFDLEDEIVNILERKRLFGQNMHSDYCMIEGRTVNEWLSTPGQMLNFLRALETRRWIVRHQDPARSRFWQLLEGPKAPMAGVFNGYEKQLIRDWIAGESSPEPPPRRRVFPRYHDASGTEAGAAGDASRGSWPPASGAAGAAGAVGATADLDVRHLRRELLPLDDARRMERLIDFMTPSRHATPVGLFATREFEATLSRLHREH